MNLAKALKVKNRIAQRISNLQQEVRQNNSMPMAATREIDVEEAYKDLEETVEDNIRLKLLIFKSSEPIREHILRLAENKSKIAWLQTLSTRRGIVENELYDRTEPVEYDATIIKKDVDKTITELEAEIDKMQDEVDKHNHTVEIEFVEGTV